MNEWQHGLCDCYALAMMQEYPHLRLGVAGTTFGDQGGGWWPQHYFAHDDTHAYDSLGKHPLPYQGSKNQFDVVQLDQNPKDWGLPENGGPEDIERAREQIRLKS